MTPLFKKLNFKEQQAIVVLNSPDSFEAELEALHGVSICRDVSLVQKCDFAIAFANTQDQLNKASAALTAAMDGDAILWVAYPKGTSKRYQCEFNRDSGWTVLGQAGFEPVRQIAIDEDWSALRFRRVEFIKTLNRAPQRARTEAGKRRAPSK